MNSRLASGFSLAVLGLLFFLGGYVLGQSPIAPLQVFGGTAVSSSTDTDFAPFWEVWELVHERYLRQPVDDVALVEGAIDGMLATLDDPHTRYLSPQDQSAAQESMAGEFQGIGAEVEDVDGNITVVSPIDGSPAEAAGIQPGDILRQADGVELTGMDVTEAAALVRGPAGTTVSLVVERDGELLNIDIVRDVIKLATVRGEILAEGIAYVRLSRFGNTTDEELEELLPDLLAQNPSGLILDLRRNPGGALDTTVEIADQFLAEGLVLVERFGDGEERPFETNDEGLAQDIPMVVLVDEGSASAAEVLAGAIQDRGRGTLIGQISFGKGTVQTWHTLSNDGGVRVTIAEWLTPDKNSIHEIGLTPDYYIPLPEFQEGIEFEDTQLQAAIDFLEGKTIISVPPEPDLNN
ncbi:MAG: S41 family peptidase [Ardenticatenaceae bacterium]|nr:S41 family peptidase [Anaerolineales bacterium]MCB9007053.1 S41 family peptidase [Ardenticatenaceae bacterium]